jgi:uridine kinase
MEKEKNIQFISQKREDIELYLPDGRIISGKRGSTIGELFSLLGEWESAPIVGAVVEGNLRELSYEVAQDCKITPINMTTSDGYQYDNF